MGTVNVSLESPTFAPMRQKYSIRKGGMVFSVKDTTFNSCTLVSIGGTVAQEARVLR